MGASFSLSGAQILEALEERLQFLLDCEEFLLDCYRHPAKPLTTDHKDLGRWEQDRLADVVKWCMEYSASLELLDVKKLRPAEMLLAEIARLKKTEDHVRSVGLSLRYLLPDPSHAERVKLYEAGKRTLRDRLDTLTKFDDSE